MHKLFFSLSIIAVGLTIGYIIQRLVLAGKLKGDSSLSKQRIILQRIVLLGINPIATMGAIWILSFDNFRIALMPVIGILAIFTGGFASLIIGRISKLKPKQAGAFFSCGAMSNIGTIGALLVFIFLGEKAFALVPMYRLFDTIIYYAIWFPIAKSFSINVQQGETTSKLKKIITDPIVLVSISSIIMGITLNLLGVQRPKIFSGINGIFIPMSSLLLLISIGMAMKFGRIKAFMKPAVMLSGVKFLLIPFVATGSAYLLGLGKVDNGLPLKVILILSSMPVGFQALIPPSIYDLDLDLANAGWMVTTALLMLVVPLQMLIITFF